MAGSVVRVGEYRLQLPEFWVDGTVREKPGFAAYNGIATGGVSFDFHVLTGHANAPAVRKSIFKGMRDTYKPRATTASMESFMGNHLEVYRLDGCAAFRPDFVYEIAFCDAYGDLLYYGFGFATPLEPEPSLRLLFMNILNGAIVEAGPRLFERPPPTPVPFVPGTRRGVRGLWDRLRRRS